MISAGIDIGSIATKGAILRDRKILATATVFTGYNAEKAGQKVFDEILSLASLKEEDIDTIVATGYGRNAVSFADRAVTEITCHGAGAHFLDPKVRSIIDVGGQDSKAMVVNDAGKVTDFVMNDKCAAGTGRFLEVMSRALEMDLDELGNFSLKAENPARISSICTVFAESEVISLISKGDSRENISAGIHESVASRVYALARRVNVKEPAMMTGGVARNIGVVKELEKKLGFPLIISDYAQVNGAIGAAVMAGA